MKPIHYLIISCYLIFSACSNGVEKYNAHHFFDGKKVLFLGNSITQNGAYVSFIQHFLQQNHPEWNIDIISIGLGSETVSCLTEPDHPFPRPCLEERLDRALAEINPDVVVACYGMNDGIYHPLDDSIMQAYQHGVQGLKQKVENKGADLIFITPPPFDPIPIKERLVGNDAPEFGYKTPYEGYDDVLGAFREWLLTLESRTLPVVDWHGDINRALSNLRKNDPSATLAEDGVHPSMEGHLLMAKIFLEKFGLAISEEETWKKLSKDQIFLQTHAQRHLRSTSWLSYIGYTRGQTVKTISPKPLLILMAGQSNMVGSGKKEELVSSDINPNFSSVSYLNFGLSSGLKKNEKRFGPEVSMGHALQKAYPNQPIILLKLAVGGSSLLDWAPEYSSEKAEITGNARFGNLYEKFFQKIDSVMELHHPEPIALLWMQGERDARIPEAGEEYEENIEEFVTAFRNRIGDESLPFVLGVVDPPKERYPSVNIVQKAQRELSQKLSGVIAFETYQLEKWEDNLHYNTQGQLELGELFGEKVIEIIDREY